MTERLWITWEIQRRNRSMSAKLGAELFEFSLHAPSWRRYPVLMYKTVQTVLKEKPRFLFAQNPSLVLSGMAVLLGRLLGIRVVIDAHNAGLFPLEGRYPWLTGLASRINRSADLVIVTNEPLMMHVEASGGRAIVMPDPLPEIASADIFMVNEGTFNIAFVCSWADDEPYDELIRAARTLSAPVTFYMTGNSRGRHEIDMAGLPENVILTGYLSAGEYEGLLHACDAVMVLTKRSNCLVCGAYEGVSAEKPLVLSDTGSLRSYFSSGVIYAQNTSSGICNAVEQLIAEHTTLNAAIRKLKKDLTADTDRNVLLLERRLQELCA